MTTTTIPSYESVEKMIYKLVTNFWRRYGGDYDELLSAANLAYVICRDKYDPSGPAKFSTFLYRCVCNCMLGVERSNRRRKKREMLVDNQFWNVLIPRSATICDFRQDAKTVVRLLLVSYRLLLHTKKRSECKNILCWYLNREGWTAKQITETFKEIGRIFRISNTKTREEIVHEYVQAAIDCWEHCCDEPLHDGVKGVIEHQLSLFLPIFFTTNEWTVYIDQLDKKLAEQETEDETPEA